MLKISVNAKVAFIGYLSYLCAEILFESMLNRRILRTKAFKAIYAFAENPSLTLKECEAMLDISCESTRDLYLFLLSIVAPLTDVAKERMEVARAKFNPTAEERNPNLKFIDNSIAPLLAEDPDFSKILKRKKLSWDDYDAFLFHLYEHLRSQKYFTDYLERGGRSIEEDSKLWGRIFEREFEDNEELSTILEDLSIYWNDDLGYALSWCCKTVLSLGRGERWQLLPLYQSELPDRRALESDKAFVYGVLRSAYLNFETFCQQVSALTPKWTRDRLCTTDLVLIACGMAEARAFPGTPIRIIINEYVELSKCYSTPESSAFVNGLLDKLINNKENA